MDHKMNPQNMSESNQFATILRELDARMIRLKLLLEANKAPMTVLEAFEEISFSKNILAHLCHGAEKNPAYDYDSDYVYDSDDPENDDDIAKTEPEIDVLPFEPVPGQLMKKRSAWRPRKRDGALGNATTWRLRLGKKRKPHWLSGPDEVAVATQACALETAPAVPYFRFEVPLLEFPKDAKITKLCTGFNVGEGWFTGLYHGKTGAFPASYVKNFSRNRKWQRSKSNAKRARKKQALKKRSG